MNMVNTVNKVLNKFGIEIRRKSVPAIPRTSMRGCLEQAIKNGLNPQTVIDVGVAQGTPELYELFPRARHILIEPLEEFSLHLKRIASGLERCEYIAAAATSAPGKVVLNVHPDLVGSSIYSENEPSDVNGAERMVQAVTLDGVCRERQTSGPYLVKIDTQGSELDVLKGAGQILKDTEFIVLEGSLFEFFKNNSLLHKSVAFMKNHGFITYDIFDLNYRPLDGAMAQANIAFVKEKSKFRQFHFYATKAQRDKQDKHLRAMLGKCKT